MAAAVLIAAPASGQGKTTLACALARLHARAGARVRAFKCGPDFLDPQWLALASGAPVHGLDLWINGEADCAQRLAAAAAEADLIVIEGVMGLHDGEPSAADLALHFQVPVVAVVDASAMAGTLAAVAHGLQTWRPGLPWAGVMANRVAGERHAQMLQQAAGTRMPWCGALMRDERFTLPSRHLGLAGAAELPDALARLDLAADALAATPLGIRPLEDWPQWQAPAAPPSHAVPPLLRGQRIAIARDAAFAFIYAATCDACRQPTLAHDVVNYGSMEGGYRQLCGRCFNEAAASRLGLRGFEHVVFEPVRMVDERGTEHEFQFRTRLFGPGMAIDAFELRDGSPAGYEFQVIGAPDDDPLELLGKLIGKMRRALALTHLDETDHGPQVNDRLIGVIVSFQQIDTLSREKTNNAKHLRNSLPRTLGAFGAD